MREHRRWPGLAESFWEERHERRRGERGGRGIRAVGVGRGACEAGDEAAGLGLDLVGGEDDGGDAGAGEMAGEGAGRVEERGEVGHGVVGACLAGSWAESETGAAAAAPPLALPQCSMRGALGCSLSTIDDRARLC